ncbi:MAG: helix-turn-helix domain-containing protein [Conexivisphaerales archaeon]
MPSVKDASAEVRVLGHPVRKRLIELLGEKQSLSFSQLREETGLPVGTLYYHLDVLSDLISQNHDKKYTLTKEGIKFYSDMAQKEGLPIPKEARSTSLVPAWIFTRLSSRNVLSAVSFVVIIVVGSYLFAYSSHSLLLMNTYANQGFLLSLISFPSAVLSFYIYSLLAALLSGRRFVSIGSFFSSSLVYLPYIFVGLAFFLHLSQGVDVLLIVMQLASIIIGSGYFSSQFGFRLERSLLIQLIYFVVSTITFFLLVYQQQV